MGKFSIIEKGLFKGDIVYERDVPEWDFSSKRGKFGLAIVWLIGWIIPVIVGGIVGVVVFFCSGSAFYGWLCVFLALIIWFVFLSRKTYRIVKYRRNFMLDDVEFMSVSRVESLGERCMNLIDDLNPADYFIAYSRFYWAEHENEPFRNIEDWVGALAYVHHGGAVGHGLTFWMRKKFEPRKYDPEWVLDEIIELSGGTPMPREIIGVFKSEFIPEFIERYGERVTKFYLAFLFGPRPILPYSEEFTEDELLRVAESNDFDAVINHIQRTIS